MLRYIRRLVGHHRTWPEALQTLFLLSLMALVVALFLSVVLTVACWVLGLVVFLLMVAVVVSSVVDWVQRLIRHVGNRSKPSGVNSKSGPLGPFGS